MSEGCAGRVMKCGDDIGMHGQASPFRAPVRMGGLQPRVAASRQPWAIEDNLFEVIPIQVQRRTTRTSPGSPQAPAVCGEAIPGKFVSISPISPKSDGVAGRLPLTHRELGQMRTLPPPPNWAMEDYLFEVIPIQVQRRTTGAIPGNPQAPAVCGEKNRSTFVSISHAHFAPARARSMAKAISGSQRKKPSQ